MHIDCSAAPAANGPAEPRRTWIAPAVLDLGGMRNLTLLQPSGIGGCEFGDPDCEFP